IAGREVSTNAILAGVDHIHPIPASHPVQPGGVGADEIALNQVACGANFDHLDIGIWVSGNHVARADAGAADEVSGRLVNKNSIFIPDGRGASRVRADIISLDGVARRKPAAETGANQDATVSIPGDEVARARHRAADEVRGTGQNVNAKLTVAELESARRIGPDVIPLHEAPLSERALQSHPALKVSGNDIPIGRVNSTDLIA